MAAVLAPVIPLHRRGRPSRADDLEMELGVRRSEEQRMADQAAPLIARLFVIAQDYGPAAWQTVAALDYLLRRHRRRWVVDDAA